MAITSKKLLKFYFRADRLNDALDNLILRSACSSALGGRPAMYYAERLCMLVEVKGKLAELWGYLDGVMSDFCVEDRAILQGYALGKGGYSRLPRDRANVVRRVVVRFMRRAWNIGSYSAAVRLVSEYFALTGR